MSDWWHEDCQSIARLIGMVGMSFALSFGLDPVLAIGKDGLPSILAAISSKSKNNTI